MTLYVCGVGRAGRLALTLYMHCNMNGLKVDSAICARVESRHAESGKDTRTRTDDREDDSRCVQLYVQHMQHHSTMPGFAFHITVGFGVAPETVCHLRRTRRHRASSLRLPPSRRAPSPSIVQLVPEQVTHANELPLTEAVESRYGKNVTAEPRSSLRLRCQDADD